MGVLVLGEVLIDLFAEPGVALAEAKSFRPAPGGAPANVAVALARLGARVGFIGKVGRDPFGVRLRELLAAEGIDTTHLLVDPRAPTMLAVVAAKSPTEQEFVLYSGASALLTPAELPADALAAAHAFVYGSVTLAGGAAPAAVEAVRVARRSGVPVVFDVNLRPALWPDLEAARARIAEAVASADVLKLNDAELEFLTGERDPARGAAALLERGPQLVCVTLGADGAYAATARGGVHAPGFAVPVRDTTGSGDAFLAGLTYRLLAARQQPALNAHALTQSVLSEPELAEIITFANACGALAATAVGAMSALPREAEVTRLLAGR